MAARRVVEHRLARPWAQPVGAAVLLVSGGVLVKLSLIDTLAAVREHAPTVSYSTQGALGGVLFSVLGLALLAASAKGVSLREQRDLGVRNPENGKLTARGWAVVVVTLAIALALELGFRSYLRDHGYDS